MKKVVFAVPPMNSEKGYPTITQNRQFQWFKDPTFIYPIVPAMCASMLVRENHQVLWLDAVAEELDEVEFGRIILANIPDYIIFECPTPVIDRYIEIINGIKAQKDLEQIKIILCGQHVSGVDVPECKADHIVKGGKWHYDVYKIIAEKEYPADTAPPHIDRNLTRWWLYGYNNGNFKYIPATYIMSAMDCWHRPGCTFCSWANMHPEYKVRAVDDVLAEIRGLVGMGFKEIFDDSGTFPTGVWLRELCHKIISEGLNEHVDFGCNMRFGALERDDFNLLKAAGFRMILFGVESVNQKTLDAINKKTSLVDMVEDLTFAKQAGLQSHLTVMFGLPYEELKDARETYNMVKKWLLNGYAYSAQATICTPYPNTDMFKKLKAEGLIKTEDWNDYDMSKVVIKLPYDDKEVFKMQKGIYNVAFHPRFLWRKLTSVRDMDDLKYFLRIGKKVYDRFGQFHTSGKATLE